MQQALDMRFSAVESFVNKASKADDAELQNYLSRFGTVLICGNIERSIEIIILSRLQERAHPRVLNFVKSYFTRGQNLDCTAIEQLLNRFDAAWYRSFSRFVEDNPRVKEGVSSCYAIRNSAAHGGTQGIGERHLRELLAASKEAINGVVTATR